MIQSRKSIAAFLMSGGIIFIFELVAHSCVTRTFSYLEFISVFAFSFVLWGGVFFLPSGEGRASKIYAWICGIFLLFFTVFVSTLAGYFISEERELSKSDIFAVFNTSTAEASEFLVDNIMNSLFYALPFYAVVVLFCAGYALYSKRRRYTPPRIKGLHALWLFMAVCIMTAFQFFGSEFAPLWCIRQLTGLERENSFFQVRRQSALTTRRSSARELAPHKDEKGEVFILVIGESATRDLMGAWGYRLDNTPYLTSCRTRKGCFFPIAFSSSVMTASTVPRMLNLENIYNTPYADYVNDSVPGLLDMANEAGFETFFITTQMRVNDEISILSDSAEHYFYPGRSDELLPGLAEKLFSKSDSSRNRLFIIHTIGSHAPASKRVPASFEPRFGRDKFNSEKMYRYSVSIEYTDMILEKLYSIAEKSFRGTPVCFMYVSDHGEVPGKGRSIRASAFKPQLVRIPFFIRVSEAYAERHAARIAVLKSNLPKPLTNDLVTDLMLGMMEISYSGSDGPGNLASVNYGLDYSDLRLMENRMRIINGEFVFINE